MIDIKDLTVGYRTHPVLSHCSAQIYPGEITALLGLNGTGKTTLIRAMLGLLSPASGSITVDAQSLTGHHVRLSANERAKLLSYVPQRSDAGFSYTCQEFVAMGAVSYLGAFSSPKQDMLEKANRILSELGCGDLTHRSLDQISGGENRMAYLARAIMQDAKYMLMDEPVSSLDLSRQHLFLRKLREYIDQSGHGCMLSVHDPALILPFADRFLFMHEGEIRIQTSKQDVDFTDTFDRALHLLYGEELQITHMKKGIHLTY